LVTIATVTSLAKNQTRSEKSVTINQPLDHLDGTSHGARARLNNTTRTRQHGVSLVEEFVHFSCGLSALGYGPNDQRLTAAAISSGKNVRQIGFVVLGVEVGTRVKLELELVADGAFRTQETHGEQDQIGGEDFFSSRYLVHLPSAAVIFGPFYVDCLHTANLPLAVVGKLLSQDAEDSWIASEAYFDLRAKQTYLPSMRNGSFEIPPRVRSLL
jgi:hypothetical protein